MWPGSGEVAVFFKVGVDLCRGPLAEVTSTCPSFRSWEVESPPPPEDHRDFRRHFP